jgi:hypothetical protein
MKSIIVVALLVAILGFIFAQQAAVAEKKAVTKPVDRQSPVRCFLRRRITPAQEKTETKKVANIFNRLLKKADKESAIAKLPARTQVKIAKAKLENRETILKNILKKVTVASSKDDEEKKTLKTLLREFAAKDLLKAHVQLKKLKAARIAKKGTSKGSRRGSRRGSRKGTMKPAVVAKALADSEFLGSLGQDLAEN